MELRYNLHSSYLPLRDDGERGKIATMVQKQMQLDSSLGSAKFGPVKEADTEVNDGGIEADQFVLKPELLFGLDLALASFEKLHKDSLVELPGAVLIGISQSGTTGGADAQMLQFTFTASQPSGNFGQIMGSAQLTEDHGHKLAPTSKPSAMTFGFCLFHSLLELDSRKQLKELT